MELVILIFVLVIILLIVSSLPTKCILKNRENFAPGYGYYKLYCPSCGWNSRYECSGCSNCGYCITANGSGECTPGDSSGPYFRQDCVQWEYDSPYFYYIGNNVYPVSITRKYPKKLNY